MIPINYESHNLYNLKTSFNKISIKNNTKYITVKFAIYHFVNSMNRFVDEKSLKDICPNYNGRKITPYDVISFSKLVL